MDKQEMQHEEARVRAGNGQGGRPQTPEEIERELDATRTEMNATIEAITRKISPEALTQRAVEYFQWGGKDFARNFGEAIQRNPVPAALTGIGIGWLMWADRYGHGRGYSEGPGVSERISAGTSAAKERWSHTRESTSSAMSRARERAADTRDSARMWATRASRAGSEWSERGRHLYHEQPLVVGALGVAIGALIGAAIPRTRREEELVRPYTEKARSSASEMAEKAKEQATSSMEEVTAKAEATSREAERSKQAKETEFSRKGKKGGPQGR